jgi:hypothetical protein
MSKEASMLRLKRKLSFVVVCAAALGFCGSAGAASIVTNGGFETGDLTGWTSGGGNIVASGSSFVHSGTFGVAFGAVGVTSPLSQALSTTPGQTYTVSFWLNSNNAFPNEIALSWSGTNILDLVNFTTSGWQQYSFTETASASSTTLLFGLRQDPGFSGLDDISVSTGVSAVPLPAALPLFATGLGALGLLGWRRKRKAAALAA